MNESILNALMRLFAIVANVDDEGLSPKARKVVLDYLNIQLNQELANKYIGIFDHYLKVHHKKKRGDATKARKRISLNSVKVLTICNEINEELQQSEKLIVLLRLLEFISKDNITDAEIDFIQTVADVFNIPRYEFEDIFSFILEEPNKIKSQEKVLVVSKKNPFGQTKYNTIKEKGLNGYLEFLYLESVNIILLIYRGNDNLKLNNFNIISGQTYVFDSGSVVKSSIIQPLYYTEILSVFRNFESGNKVTLLADNIKFTFPNSTNGIKPFTISERSGRLVGIMGGSGAGKSTLLSILIGNIKVNSGSIKINGYDLYEDKKLLDGIIGFVPQDDLLIEELTVFQNLYFNAKVCFRNASKIKLLKIISKVLHELDLYEIRNLKVGNPLKKFISGGQRKRLNIALELIREPAILYADEPTSGLSSSDSEIVMSLLKELTYKGKLVFVNIHQPSSDIYKLFDKIIIIDKGGHPVYYGNPLDAVVYFRTNNSIANADESLCPTCGNVNPEQVLELIENKVVNEFGRLTDKRKFTPQKWYSLYQAHISENPVIEDDYNYQKEELPEIMYNKASSFQQFVVFSKRNFLRKISNIQYILLNILEAPILAFILALFSKYVKGTNEDPSKYIFAENVNIPSFMFMAVTVALFLGLTVSAEEIIKDRRILKREKFLNLSHWSYLNSKIAFLFVLSAIQTFLFVLISNAILEINGLTLKFWLIMFSTAFWANLMGLVISSAMNSVVTIYITIPLILIPQLLFSGTVIDFTKLYKPFAGDKYSPIIGDVMISRWSYEALMVTQFTDNLYQKHFFETEKIYENATYYSNSYYNKLEEIVNFLYSNKNNDDKKDFVDRRFRILINEIKKVEKMTGIKFSEIDKINKENFDENIKNNLIQYLFDYLKQPNLKLSNNSKHKRDSIVYSLEDDLGASNLVVEFKEQNVNYKIEDFVCNDLELQTIVEGKNELIRRYKPIYQIPVSNIGRAQFYAAEKIVLGKTIKTIWYNVIVIWLYSLLMYIILVTKILDINNSPFKKLKDK